MNRPRSTGAALALTLGTALLAACTAPGSETVADVGANAQPIAVSNGYLVFKSQEEYDQTRAYLAQRPLAERIAWEGSFPGFRSQRAAFMDLTRRFDALDAEAAGSAARTAASEASAVEGLAASYPLTMKRFVNKDGTESFRPDVSPGHSASMLNAAGLVQIGSRLYRYGVLTVASGPLGTAPEALAQAQSADPAKGIDVRAVAPPTKKAVGTAGAAGSEAAGSTRPLDPGRPLPFDPAVLELLEGPTTKTEGDTFRFHVKLPPLAPAAERNYLFEVHSQGTYPVRDDRFLYSGFKATNGVKLTQIPGKLRQWTVPAGVDEFEITLQTYDNQRWNGGRAGGSFDYCIGYGCVYGLGLLDPLRQHEPPVIGDGSHMIWDEEIQQESPDGRQKLVAHEQYWYEVYGATDYRASYHTEIRCERRAKKSSKRWIGYPCDIVGKYKVDSPDFAWETKSSIEVAFSEPGLEGTAIERSYWSAMPYGLPDVKGYLVTASRDVRLIEFRHD